MIRHIPYLLAALVLVDIGSLALAQTEITGDNARAARIVIAVQNRAGRALSVAETESVRQIVVDAEQQNYAISRNAVGSNAAAVPVEVVRSDVRVARRAVRQNARSRISTALNQDIAVPRLMDRMPHVEGTSCELVSLDYVVWPDDKQFGVYPPKGSDISGEQYRANFRAACQCGWQDSPTFTCVDMTRYTDSGVWRTLNP
jgi:hypothetical protein